MSQDGAPLSEQLDSVGSKVTAVYAPVVENLQQVRILARAFETGIEGLNPQPTNADGSEQDGAGDAPPGDMRSAALDLRDTIAAAVAGIEHPVITNELRNLRSASTRLDNNGRELSALSFLMLVTAANGQSSRMTVEHLVNELRELSQSLRSESDGIVAALEQVDQVRRASAASLNNALALVEAHIDGPAKDHAALEDDTAEDDGALNALRRMARSLSGEIGRRMPGIVACMQHPDAFAQRCDHIARAAEHLAVQDAGTALQADLRKLIAAQAADMHDELSEIQASTIQSLEGITTSSRETSVAFADGLKRDRRLDRIAERRKGIEETHLVMQGIRDVADGSLRDLETCFDVFDGVAETFDRLNRMRQAVRLSSLNADLSERQSEINTPELRSVTKAVGECATNCGSTIAILNASFTKISSAFSSVDRQGLGASIATVVAHLNSAQAEMSRLAEDVGRIQDAARHCGDTLDDLVSNAGSAASRIEANSLSLKWLEQISETAALPGPDTTDADRSAEDGEILGRIFASYSIERERDVHRAALGEAAPVAEGMTEDTAEDPQDDADDDPLASVLF